MFIRKNTLLEKKSNNKKIDIKYFKTYNRY